MLYQRQKQTKMICWLEQINDHSRLVWTCLSVKRKKKNMSWEKPVRSRTMVLPFQMQGESLKALWWFSGLPLLRLLHMDPTWNWDFQTLCPAGKTARLLESSLDTWVCILGLLLNLFHLFYLLCGLHVVNFSVFHTEWLLRLWNITSHITFPGWCVVLFV